MTGGSLGLRTGSYGSLQQQQQSPNNSILPIQQTSPLVVRKPLKMCSKERFLPRICKLFGRRRAGMLILAAVSLLVFLSLFTSLYKEEDAQEVPVNRMPVQSISHDGNKGATMINIRSTIEYGEHGKTNDEFKPSNVSLHELENRGHLHFPASPPPPPIATPVAPLTVHPCAHFMVPPPPPSDRRRIGPRPCPVCYIPVEQAKSLMPATPSISPVVKNLTYIVQVENLVQNNSAAGSTFGGYPSLAERDDSYNLKESMTIHCGFVRGNKPGSNTGFDINEADLLEMELCDGIVVASAVFGNYDEIQQPKNISDVAKRDVCFFMFVDEETMSFINKTNALDSTRRLGLWRVVLVNNLPYADARRTGKVPKLLLHRLFPNVRFSIWIDGKLELVRDPYQILERFLWRTNATFAISRHYRRFDVFEEAEANKAAGKYDNASIDAQVEFYKKEGLSPYSSAKLPITSDVPEGCVIIREHIPVTNLFTCLWFNEVDRFTSRDQLSFSTVRDKFISKVNWGINMFLDCERRNFVIQAYHRDVLEQRNAMRAAAARLLPVVTGDRHVNLPRPPATPLVNDRVVVRNPVRKLPTKRVRERKTGSRRHRSKNAGFKETNFS
ncbi:probable hexosyltransferase MUCI70 [Nymphaea colorata]|nr:probable hexosyltransferase MUCI70 [Nymphaea colorata]